MPCGDAPRRARPSSSLPSALSTLSDLAARVKRDQRRVVFFLDFDGTLSPIVDDPDAASLPPLTRDALSVVAARFTTAIVSGRSTRKVQHLVGLSRLIYAGSHGFDIVGPDGVLSHRVAADWLPSLAAVRRELSTLLPRFPGALVEDNLLSISFHYRKVDSELLPDVDKEVAEVVQRHGLRRTNGKMVYEARPRMDWHKGKAVEYLLKELSLTGPEVLPIYIGDDVTDEDAFKVLHGRGISVIVADPGGARDTYADMRLNDPIEVQRFLMRFATDETLAPRLANVLLAGDVKVASE